jgi:hypothetical protein
MRNVNAYAFVYLMVQHYIAVLDGPRWRGLRTTAHYSPMRSIHKWMRIEQRSSSHFFFYLAIYGAVITTRN